MSDKRLELSVLPDGFLIECGIPDDTGRTQFNDLAKFNIGWVEDELTQFKQKFRPALNHWIFNDGSMVLPDGLVVEQIDRSKRQNKGWIENNTIWRANQKDSGMIVVNTDDIPYSEDDFVDEIGFDVIAVRILGVHPDFADHGAELGMEVIEV